jgi:hypothetical protein
LFCSYHFSFLVTFGYEIKNIIYSFFYILQGKMGKMEKNRKEIYSTKVTKNQKTKIWDEWNIWVCMVREILKRIWNLVVAFKSDNFQVKNVQLFQVGWDVLCSKHKAEL